jgi:hypothetical protein
MSRLYLMTSCLTPPKWIKLVPSINLSVTGRKTLHKIFAIGRLGLTQAAKTSIGPPCLRQMWKGPRLSKLLNKLPGRLRTPGGQDDPGDISMAKNRAPNELRTTNGVLLHNTDKFSEHMTSTPELHSDVHDNGMARC